jgi:predicted RNA-binding protein with PUA-like domain
MPRRHWLVKSEPFKYSFEQLARDGRTVWDGVRNFEARNNLRAMARGDLLLFYHSNEGLAVVGVARVAREAYPDPSAPDEGWSVVDVEPVAPLPEPVPLTSLRAAPALASMAILRRSRLSVTPVTPAEYDEVLRLGKADPRAVERAAATKSSDAKGPAPAKATPVKVASAAKAARGVKATSAAKTSPAAKAPPAAKAGKTATKAGKAAARATRTPAATKATRPPAATKATRARASAAVPEAPRARAAAPSKAPRAGLAAATKAGAPRPGAAR